MLAFGCSNSLQESLIHCCSFCWCIYLWVCVLMCMFVPVCVHSSTEIDDMIRKSTNLLLTRTLSHCLQYAIKKKNVGLAEVMCVCACVCVCVWKTQLHTSLSEGMRRCYLHNFSVTSQHFQLIKASTKHTLPLLCVLLLNLQLCRTVIQNNNVSFSTFRSVCLHARWLSYWENLISLQG